MNHIRYVATQDAKGEWSITDTATGTLLATYPWTHSSPVIRALANLNGVTFESAITLVREGASHD